MNPEYKKDELLLKTLIKNHVSVKDHRDCAHQPRSDVRYSGLTTCTLSRRLTGHLQNGAIKSHSIEKHGRKITRAEIVEMTKARYYVNDFQRLEILEALIILFEDPVINRQDTGRKRILKLFGSGSGRINQSINQQGYMFGLPSQR